MAVFTSFLDTTRCLSSVCGENRTRNIYATGKNIFYIIYMLSIFISDGRQLMQTSAALRLFLKSYNRQIQLL